MLSSAKQYTMASPVDSDGRAKFPHKTKEAQLSFNTNVLYEESSAKFVPQKCELQLIKENDSN